MEIMPEYFLYLGLGLIGIELFVGVDTGFDLVLLGISTILGGLGFWLTGSLWVGVGITTIVTFSYIFFGRKFLKAKLFHSHHKTNIDRLIDNQGLVIKKAIKQIGFDNVSEVRFGKFIQIEINDKDKSEEEIIKEIDYLSDKLLANPNIENYKYEIVRN